MTRPEDEGDSELSRMLDDAIEKIARERGMTPNEVLFRLGWAIFGGDEPGPDGKPPTIN